MVYLLIGVLIAVCVCLIFAANRRNRRDLFANYVSFVSMISATFAGVLLAAQMSYQSSQNQQEMMFLDVTNHVYREVGDIRLRSELFRELVNTDDDFIIQFTSNNTVEYPITVEPYIKSNEFAQFAGPFRGALMLEHHNMRFAYDGIFNNPVSFGNMHSNLDLYIVQLKHIEEILHLIIEYKNGRLREDQVVEELEALVQRKVFDADG